MKKARKEKNTLFDTDKRAERAKLKWTRQVGDLKESSEAWMKIRDEADGMMEQTRIQEYDLRQCSARCEGTWETTERQVEAIDEKVWKLHQSSDTMRMNLVQDWGNFKVMKGCCRR